jgi:outer membrane lipoprotein-sorting protein
MRTIFVLLLMLHCVSTQAQTQEEVFQILEKTYQKLTNLESISYQVNHSSKFYWKNDTILMTNQTVHIYKKPYKNHKNAIGFPEIYNLDSDGTIIKTYISLCDSYKIEIKNILNKLLNE